MASDSDSARVGSRGRAAVATGVSLFFQVSVPLLLGALVVLLLIGRNSASDPHPVPADPVAQRTGAAITAPPFTDEDSDLRYRSESARRVRSAAPQGRNPAPLHADAPAERPVAPAPKSVAAAPLLARSEMPELVQPPTPTSQGTDTVGTSTGPLRPASGLRQEGEASAPLPTPARKQLLVPAGTVLTVRLVESLSSDRNLPGSPFTATLEYPLVIEGVVIAERYQRVEGIVTESQRAGKMQGVATLSLRLVRLHTKDTRLFDIVTVPKVWLAPKQVARDAATIGALGAIGAVIGGLAGGGKEAAIGAAAGAGAGTAATLATRGAPVRLPSETVIEFRLRESLLIPLEAAP